MGLLADGWTKRQTISIQPTTAALAEFTAVLTEAMLPSVVTDVLFDAIDGALTTGGDLRISVDKDGDTLVGLDFRRWDKAAGKIEIAYRVPTTSALLITTLYLWWGKEGAEQPAANELGGQHSAYDDDTIFCAPVGSGVNRTAFNITGTDVGDITAGDIAAPSGLLGTQHTDVGDYSTYGDNPDLDLVNTDWTMSFLFRATTSGLEQYVLGKYDHTTQNRGYLCIFSGSQHFDLTYQPVRTSYNPIYRLSSGVDVVDGQWHHLAGTFISGTRASVYVDGILRNTTTNNIPSSIASNNASFQIGTQVTAQNRPADFSHVTVHSVARSAEWLKAENDNFRDPNSFYDAFPAPDYVSEITTSYDLRLNVSVDTSIAYSFDYTTELIVERAVTILYDLKLDVDDGSGIPISVSYDLKLDVSTVFFTSYDVSLNVAIISFTSYDILLNVFNSIETDYDLRLDVSTVFFTSYDLKLDVSDNSGVPIFVSYDLSLNILFNVETNYDLRLNVLSNLGYSFDYNTVLDVVRNINTSYDIKLIIDYEISTSYDLRLNVLSIYGHSFDYNTVLDVIRNINTSYDVSLTVIDILNELITICDIEYSTSSFNVIDVRLLDSESFIEFFNSIIYVSYTPILVNTCELLFSISDIGVYFGVNNSENLFSTCDISFDLPIINSILNISLSLNSIIEFNLSEVALVRQLLILTDDVITFNTTNILLSILHELDTNSVIVINTNSITIYLERFNISNIKSYENVTVIRSYESLICRKGE
ncbi:capsid protein [Desulfofustis phage LS06-2018-MD01]|jgi:hypothetical protein|nr:capsid protein [Desulfofustis phage LS06-2018-MD01]